ncbi:Sec-independent protein translocase subunit TatA/TatB [Pontibacter oryzae]|uniref:Sec-independent protein translocase protein TatA n=1 Tax=Pontibacter oryzae TaxID=2304593 RepID=A0A399SI58_9BACT|nr:twin-arginine translocase TatA/TatE family subunit [Pontibacter oryzae]RIJ41385.1 twin-arginine translocase TatA/TatE family subunit [Pontibacter oryzae]
MESNTILLFMGLGGMEIFLIIVALLLLFGAKKIPELARGMGRGIREFKDATNEVKKDLEDSDQNPQHRP